ncbi:MAG TPA: DUF3574 domain-containing protein [Stellaceae bacterium]|nr:DUF3574 domain-containing protein [Stellaceae bacterium]
MRRARMGAVLLAAALAGCASHAAPDCAPPARAMPEVELFFGRGLPGGGMVSERDWQRFLDEAVTPRFPDGLTVLDAEGQWRDGDTVQRERTKLLLIVAPPAPDLEARLAAVIDGYKQRFQQQAVLRIDRTACVRWH